MLTLQPGDMPESRPGGGDSVTLLPVDKKETTQTAKSAIRLRHQVFCFSGTSYFSPLAHQVYDVIKSRMKKAQKARNWIRWPCA